MTAHVAAGDYHKVEAEPKPRPEDAGLVQISPAYVRFNDERYFLAYFAICDVEDIRLRRHRYFPSLRGSQDPDRRAGSCLGRIFPFLGGLLLGSWRCCVPYQNRGSNSESGEVCDRVQWTDSWRSCYTTTDTSSSPSGRRSALGAGKWRHRRGDCGNGSIHGHGAHRTGERAFVDVPR
jgi:hypothetical protein